MDLCETTNPYGAATVLPWNHDRLVRFSDEFPITPGASGALLWAGVHIPAGAADRIQDALDLFASVDGVVVFDHQNRIHSEPGGMTHTLGVWVPAPSASVDFEDAAKWNVIIRRRTESWFEGASTWTFKAPSLERFCPEAMVDHEAFHVFAHTKLDMPLLHCPRWRLDLFLRFLADEWVRGHRMLRFAITDTAAEWVEHLETDDPLRELVAELFRANRDPSDVLRIYSALC